MLPPGVSQMQKDNLVQVTFNGQDLYYCDDGKRRHLIMEKLDRRKRYIKIARKHGLKSYVPFKKLLDSCGRRERFKLEELLTARLRSNFRKSLRSQVVKWLKETHHKYKTPLSREQWPYL